MRPFAVIPVVLSCACAASTPAVQSADSAEPACRGDLGDLHGKVSRGWVEPPGDEVAAIRVRGTRTVPEDPIRDAIRLPEGEPLDPATVRADIRRILELRVFEDVRVRAESRSGRVIVTYEVVERPLIREAHVTGLGEGVREPRLDYLAGEVFVPQRLRRLAGKLTSDHRREGYANAVTRVRGRRRDARSVDVCFVVDAGRRWLIERFAFTGNHRLDDEELLGFVRTFEGRVNTEGGVYRKDVLQQDLSRVEAAYYDHGMVGVRVSGPRTTWEQGELDVEVPIEEGPVYSLGRITVTGDLQGPAREYRSLVDIAPGEVFSRARVADAVEQIRARDAERDVQVSPEVEIDEENHTIDVEIRVTARDEPGPPQDGSEVEVELLDDTLHIDYPPPREIEP